jgi:hypothetical protein
MDSSIWVAILLLLCWSKAEILSSHRLCQAWEGVIITGDEDVMWCLWLRLLTGHLYNDSSCMQLLVTLNGMPCPALIILTRSA